ncbi:MAG TPA: glycosyltransferase family 39 protein [Polyangiaceae bacterium]|jgi:hypothetical protein|nr:glycosyltransferase family 39 protein [Polyangiaceae bacterium]
MPEGPPRAEAGLLVGLSGVLLAVRLFAASRVGFGDSEALYASYALHPQPAYLDHPGMVGVFARAIGEGTAPSPERAHVVTSVLATLVPGAMALLCRAAGGSWRRSLLTAVVVALVPEIAIGLFAMTPDLLLALLWMGSLALGAVALRSTPGGARASLAFAGAGLLAGAASGSKATGILLVGALVATYASRAARPHARTIAPWAGIAAGLVVLVPIARFEARTGWPMLVHRLADTQADAGLSLRNLGALFGGQLVYLSPVVAFLAVLGARESWRQWKGESEGVGDPVAALLFLSSAVPGAALLALALWSRVAEPHWIAPALLSLGPSLARAPLAPPRRLVIVAAAIAGAMVIAVHAWVLVPGAVRLAPASYDAHLDIANELYGWPDALSVVRNEVAAQATPDLDDVSVVGPHWVICAQLEADLRGDVHVGCDTPIPDDFDGWWPRSRWRSADSIVWVTDDRFGLPAPPRSHALIDVRKVRIKRADRIVRTFTIAVWVRRAQG